MQLINTHIYTGDITFRDDHAKYIEDNYAIYPNLFSLKNTLQSLFKKGSNGVRYKHSYQTILISSKLFDEIDLLIKNLKTYKLLNKEILVSVPPQTFSISKMEFIKILKFVESTLKTGITAWETLPENIDLTNL